MSADLGIGRTALRQPTDQAGSSHQALRHTGARPAVRAGAGRKQERRPGARGARHRLSGGSAFDEVWEVLPRHPPEMVGLCFTGLSATSAEAL